MEPQCSVLDLKAWHRGSKYVRETLMQLLRKLHESLVLRIYRQVASLGRIHPAEALPKAA